jgi:hypothetical protein
MDIRVTDDDNEVQAPPLTPSKKKGKWKAKKQKAELQEPLDDKTHTKKKIDTPMPQWMKEAQEEIAMERTIWQWALSGAPIRRYNIPDIMGKETLRARYLQKLVNFVTSHIPDFRVGEVGKKGGMWVCPLRSQKFNKGHIIDEAVKDMLGLGYMTAHIPQSVWVLMYSHKKENIAKNLVNKALIHMVLTQDEGERQGCIDGINTTIYYTKIPTVT